MGAPRSAPGRTASPPTPASTSSADASGAARSAPATSTTILSIELADPEGTRRIEAIGDHLALNAALAALSDEYRLPVVLRDVADLDYAEIAAVLDIPAGTVRSRIARGRAALAKALSAEPGNQQADPERPSRAP